MTYLESFLGVVALVGLGFLLELKSLIWGVSIWFKHLSNKSAVSQSFLELRKALAHCHDRKASTKKPLTYWLIIYKTREPNVFMNHELVLSNRAFAPTSWPPQRKSLLNPAAKWGGPGGFVAFSYHFLQRSLARGNFENNISKKRQAVVRNSLHTSI